MARFIYIYMKYHALFTTLALAAALPQAFANLTPELKEQIDSIYRHDAEPATEEQLKTGQELWEGKRPASIDDFRTICLYAKQQGFVWLHASPDRSTILVANSPRNMYIHTHYRAFRREGDVYRLVGGYDLRTQVGFNHTLSFEEDGFVLTLTTNPKRLAFSEGNSITITRKFFYADPWDECCVFNEPNWRDNYLGNIPEQFFKAARENDTAAMKKILDAGYDLNRYRVHTGPWNTLGLSLFLATVSQTPGEKLRRVLPFLLEARADIKATDDAGNNALHIAVRAYFGSAPDVLIAAGAEVNGVNNKGETPLMFAAARMKNDNMATLLAAGADVNMKNAQGRTALHYATDPYIATDWPHEGTPEDVEEATLRIAEAMIETMQKLVAAGADVNAQDAEGNTALHLLAQSIPDAAAAAVRGALLNMGADPTLTNAAGKTPRCIAQEQGDTATCRTLDEHAATHPLP